MGIFKGSGPRLLSGARFQKEYHLLSPREINNFHQRLTGLFKALPHGPYQALCETVGEKQARILAGPSYRECTLPDADQNISTGESSQNRPSKRPRLNHNQDQEVIDTSE